ncbi:N-acetylmuramoyl-L-alanine amidase [Rahnella victoriana]|uniref:N-acetylmuramoyl-L-alanine amidase n=1 Tax=Rahnella victoriana TaxID=1510570 RepID=UPI00103C853C|nr:N-acetylmuramoyl-L-alanine amidase [Rahnella victoriana]TBX31532.1 N-acetylmuramoyl-L-alanine amidase [Rahnella victoriana]
MSINQSRRKLLIFGIGLSLTAPRLYAAQKAVRITMTSDASQIRLALPAGDKRCRVFMLSAPERAVIDMPMVSFPPELEHALTVVRQKFSWVKEGRIAHFSPDVARIVLQVDGKPEITRSTENGVLNVAIREANAAQVLPVTTTTPRAEKPLLVMIDPGHGGKDPGAIGNEGTYEKHVVLHIAKRLQTLLDEQHGIHAVLTRQDDVFIPLYHRVSLAHQHEADLFISIHADGFTNDQVSGASVFALSEHGAGSAMARYLSQSENSVDVLYDNDFKTDDQYLKETLFDLDQHETIHRSLDFGRHLAANIIRVHHMHSPHPEQAGFAVLKSPRIPSVLVETSFITNKQEEKLLGEPVFQEKMARALAEGINSYFINEKKNNLLS